MAPKYHTLRSRLVWLTTVALFTLLAAWTFWTTVLINEAPSTAAQLPRFLQMVLLHQPPELRQNPKRRVAAHAELSRIRTSLDSQHARSISDDTRISNTNANISSSSSRSASINVDGGRFVRPIDSQSNGSSTTTTTGHLCAAASQGQHAHVHAVLKSSEVQTRVVVGAQAASHLRIVFAGLVHRRQSGKDHSLALEMSQFAELGQFFRDWRVVLYESNSHASTGRQVQRLCELPAMNSKSSGESSSGSGRLSSRQVGDAKHPNTEDAALPLMEPLNRVFCLAGQAGASKGSHGDKSELRLTGMATMRNLYLNYIRAHPFLKRFDVLAVADLDLHYVTAHYLPHRMQGKPHNYSGVSLAPGWNAFAALSAFGLDRNKGIHTGGGSTSGSYGGSSSSSSNDNVRRDHRSRQISATEERPLPWTFLCANGVVEFNARHFDSFAFEPEALGQKREWVFGAHKDVQGISVTSCFGGLTFYDLPALVASNCRYRAAADVCEHSLLHRCLLKHQDKTSSKEISATRDSSRGNEEGQGGAGQQRLLGRRLTKGEEFQESRNVLRRDDGNDTRRARRRGAGSGNDADSTTTTTATTTATAKPTAPTNAETKSPRVPPSPLRRTARSSGGLLYPLLTNQMDNEAARICVPVAFETPSAPMR